MGKRQKGRERINERNIDSVIEALFYSSSCNIISTVLTSCQGLRLVDNCVHFSHGAHSKGLLFSISTTLLSREYRRSHAQRTGADTNTHICSCCIMLPHTLTAMETIKFPRMWVCIQNRLIHDTHTNSTTGSK